VVQPNAGETVRETARQRIQKTICNTHLEGKVDIRLLEGKKVATTLIRAAADGQTIWFLD
jgi:hypothetical protein